MIIELDQKKLDEKFAGSIDASLLREEELVDYDYVQEQHGHGFDQDPK